MNRWQPTEEQLESWETKGYFVIRNVIPRDTAIELRGVIKDTILKPDPGVKADADPMDPMGDTPEARAARFRKLGNFCIQSPLIWNNVHGSERVASIASYFLGDDVLLKFNSCFLKPARTGSATPWHQDNGLWRDGETEPFNIWMALDPATRANGCLQVIPGTHKGEIIQHVLYEDSIHGELPRDQVEEMISTRGVEHVELDSGDAVCWQSSLWHYSPPNTSDQGRIAVAAVYSAPDIIKTQYFTYHWVMKDGEVSAQFPPEPYPMERSGSMPPFPKAA